MGRCFSVDYPCGASLILLVKHPDYPEFNIWDSIIAPFWTNKFVDARNNTPEPKPLPAILNNYNFNSMNSTLVRGWA